MENEFLRKAQEQEKETLRHYVNDYLIELSKYIPTIKMDEHGIPIYPWLDRYWTDQDRCPYYLLVDGKIAGFVLVRRLSVKQIEIAEFCILQGYRRDGYGRQMLEAVMEMFDDEIELSAYLYNTTAIRFWDNVTDSIDIKYIYFDNKWKYYVLHCKNKNISMNLRSEYFDLVDLGVKTIEGRLNDDKRKIIEVGDIITFGCADRSHTIDTVVLQKNVYKSFDDMAFNEDLTALGFRDKSSEDVVKLYREIYPIAEEKACGVVAIHIAKCVKQSINH